MEGEHNFSNFCKSKGLFKYQTVGGVRYTPVPRTKEQLTRIVEAVEVVERGAPLPPSLYPPYRPATFIDVAVTGQSFLHNQVRRMVGAGLAVGLHRLSLPDIADLLSNPGAGWDTRIPPVKPHGLFLAAVHYKEGALAGATDCKLKMKTLEKVENQAKRQDQAGSEVDREWESTAPL